MADEEQEKPGMSPFAYAEALRKYEHEMRVWAEDRADRREQQSRMFEAVIAFSTGAIKSLFLLNGGAVVALLAFYSDRLAGADAGSIDAPALGGAIGLFVWGLVVAFGCWAAAYLAQVLFVESSGKWGYRAGAAFRVLGIGAALASVALFTAGALDAVEALLASTPA